MNTTYKCLTSMSVSYNEYCLTDIIAMDYAFDIVAYKYIFKICHLILGSHLKITN